MSISRSEILRKKKKSGGPEVEKLPSVKVLESPKAMLIEHLWEWQFWGKQEHKVSYRCSLPSPLQKRSKDQKGWHWCQNPAEDLLASTLKITRSSKTMDTCGALNSKSPLLGSGTNAILFDPWIFSAMAMAMSIYRTLCVLVFFFFFWKFHS